MSPEVALRKPYNEKVDVYSLSIILYEMFTGVTPFYGMNRKVFFTRVVNGGERPPLDHDNYGFKVGMHPELVRILKSAWDKDSKFRPSTTEILNQLENISRRPTRVSSSFIAWFSGRNND